MVHLRCSVASCAATLDLHDRALACPQCGNLLEVVIEQPALDPAALKKVWLERRLSPAETDRSGVWRFREFLPSSYAASGVVTLVEGNTPIIRGRKTAEWSDTRNLWFKHLGWNPTGSFKDLGMTAGITEAKYLGVKAVACASTGNTAASLAAYAARAGIPGRVYLPAGQASNNKLAQAFDYGATIIEVQGNFDDALDQLLASTQNAGCGAKQKSSSADLAASGESVVREFLGSNDPELYFLNSINPFRIEGQKTAMLELLEQLEWRVPDYLVVPGGNLGNSSAFGKAFEELKRFGFIDRVPRIIIVQASGANPLARMWQARESKLTPLAQPETDATAIRIGNPRSWKKALHAVELSGGQVLDVTDEEIAAAKALIGQDGIGCEPASATTLAGIAKLVRSGQMDREATMVAVLTGHVLKDTDYIIKAREKHERVAESCPAARELIAR